VTTITIPAGGGGGGGGTLQSLLITTPGAGVWPTPAGVSAAWIELQAAGGGGRDANSGPGGGGGAGELCQGMLVAVAGNMAYNVGAGGLVSADGGNTTFGPYIVLGGKAGVALAGGDGGGPNGGKGNTVSLDGTHMLPGLPESVFYFGGSAGGAIGKAGAGSGGYPLGGAGGAGGGGSATPWGKGGDSGSPAAATAYGAGGGYNGHGADGRILITWVA